MRVTVKQLQMANTRSARPISDTIQLVVTIRSLKAGWAVRMKAWPARFVVAKVGS